MKPGRKRKLVDEVRIEWQVSIRRTCAAIRFDRSTYHRKLRRSGQATLKHLIKEICHARVRYRALAATFAPPVMARPRLLNQGVASTLSDVSSS